MKYLRSLAFCLAVIVAAQASEVPLSKSGGVYTLSVTLNEVLTLQFVIDSGASEVVVPVEAVTKLIKAGTVRESDFLPGATYVLADGSKIKSPRFLIRKLQVGRVLLRDVKASIGNKGSSLLLGQSCLEKLPNWRLDTTREVFIMDESAPELRALSPATGFMLQSSSNGKLMVVKDLIARGAYETGLTFSPDAAYQVAQEIFQAKNIAEGIEKDTKDVSCSDLKIQSGLMLCRQSAEAQLKEINARLRLYAKQEGTSWAEISALQSAAKDSLHLSLESFLQNFTDPKNQATFEKWKLENPTAAKLATPTEQLNLVPGQRFLGVRFAEKNGQLIFTELLPNSPNLSSGLSPGDRIDTINGRKIRSLSDVPSAVGNTIGKTASIELTRSSGTQMQKNLNVGRYSPWGKKFYRQIVLAPVANESIGNTNSYRNRLYSCLARKVPKDTYLSVSFPESLGDLGPETLRREGSDYLIKVKVHTYEVHSAYRAFSPGNRVRVGEFKATFSLVDVESGETIWEEELAHEIDQFNDVDTTLRRCVQVVTDLAASKISEKIFNH
jgi:hypothetical protein